MFDWENDVFLSAWDKKYVITNLRPGSNSFDAEMFTELRKEIDQSGANVSGVSCCILVRCPTSFYSSQESDHRADAGT
jgi:hypothetical protein